MPKANGNRQRANTVIVVLATFPNLKTAKRIIRSLVQSQRAACGNMFRVSSIFTWRGRIEATSEYTALIKTTRGNYLEVERYIREHHPYEVPEIICWPVARGSKKYLDWIIKETDGSK